MGSASSVSMAYSEADPSANQGQLSRDVGEESKTLIEEVSNGTEEEEGEESGECGGCKYIKAGVCKEQWISLEKCVDDEEAEEEGNNAPKCREVRRIFKTCMFDNPVYYAPIISVQARVVARMISELQAEKEAVLAGEATVIAKALSNLQTEEQPPLPAEVAAIAKAFQEMEAEKEEEEENAEVSEGTRDHQPQKGNVFYIHMGIDPKS